MTTPISIANGGFALNGTRPMPDARVRASHRMPLFTAAWPRHRRHENPRPAAPGPMPRECTPSAAPRVLASSRLSRARPLASASTPGAARRAIPGPP